MELSPQLIRSFDTVAAGRLKLEPPTPALRICKTLVHGSALTPILVPGSALALIRWTSDLDIPSMEEVADLMAKVLEQ